MDQLNPSKFSMPAIADGGLLRRGSIATHVTEGATMLRAVTESDAESILEIYAPIIRASAITFEVEPPTVNEMRQRIAKALEHAPWLVVERGGVVTGYAYATRHSDRAAYQWSVNVSVYVRDGERRRGVGRALYTSLFALLGLQGFYAAHAGITLPNDGSVGLHESFGFVPVGVYRAVGWKQGAWHDVGWWQLPLRERVGAPLPPLAPSEAKAAPGYAAALAAGAPLLRL
jgi:phosphinothricin acetyltransferase